jgi:hypothetical protein
MQSNFIYRKRCGSLIVRPDELAPITPETITSSIRALAWRFAGDFGGILALMGAFRAFGIVETFFFAIRLVNKSAAVSQRLWNF